MFAFDIKKEMCGVLDFFLSFLKRFEERKTYNMFLLMLDTQFKSLQLVSSFVNHEQGISIIKEYDRKPLHPMLLKCYHHLHLVPNCEIEYTK
jgi:hypothetical protein